MVRLNPMTEAAFEEYVATSIQHYADEHVRSGRWSPDTASAQAEKEFAELLPDGTQTPGQYLLTLLDETTGQEIGMLWYGIREQAGVREAWIWDVNVAPPFRRQGYGRQAMAVLEQHVRERRLARISLHVFGHNAAARALYERMGYSPTNIVMSKTLPD